MHTRERLLDKKLTKFISLVALLIGVDGFFQLKPSSAQETGLSDIPREREIHNTFSTNKDKGTILEATNPIELINRLRDATALDNATSPSDAIDEALRALEPQEIESSSIDSRRDSI